MEAHIPFDVLSDKFLEIERLQQYQVLVLPNSACLSEAAVAAIKAFAKAGGTVIATFESGLYDEFGAARQTPGFADLFGGVYAGQRTNLKSSYAQLRDSDDPLLAGIGDTDLVPNDGDLVEFNPKAGSVVPLTLVLPVTVNSDATISIPEYSAISGATDVPIAVYASYGEGRGILFCNQMDALFYRYGFADLGRILANAVDFALGNSKDLEVIAPDYVDVTSMEQPGRWLVHLINFPVSKQLNTGWRHPGRNLIPVADIVVRIRLAGSKRIAQVRLATTEAVLAYRLDGDWVEVTVPVLDDHEIVVFEMA
ncbi:beta-galactosidase trimerization domain-containing protein [Polaromonas sp. P1(28)-13]|nr:beta-galactosidase trimerization domain-containing protein [Polaromonas sp. P1(28)-13]